MDTNLLRELFVLRFLILLGAFALALGVAALIAAWRARTTRAFARPPVDAAPTRTFNPR